MIMNIIETSGLLAFITLLITNHFTLKREQNGEDVSLKYNVSFLLLSSYVLSVAILYWIIKFLKAFEVVSFIENWKIVSLIALATVTNLLVFTQYYFMEILSQETGTTAKKAYKVLLELMKYSKILIAVLIILFILVIIKGLRSGV